MARATGCLGGRGYHSRPRGAYSSHSQASRKARATVARLREDGETLVVKCGDEERDFRMEADPDTLFTTDHYRGYPTVLVRLPRVNAGDLRDVFELGVAAQRAQTIDRRFRSQGASLADSAPFF